MGRKIEYVRIHSFPESTPQIWKMQYYIGKVNHNGNEVKMGQASLLNGNAKQKQRQRKVIEFNGFVTEWLSIK